MVFRFKEFLKEREGSDKFGAIINDIMTLLRNYKTDINIDKVKVKTSELKIDLNLLNQLKSARYNKLVAFKIIFLDKNNQEIEKVDPNGYVLFTDLNNSTKVNRPWEGFSSLL